VLFLGVIGGFLVFVSLVGLMFLFCFIFFLMFSEFFVRGILWISISCFLFEVSGWL